MSERWFAPEFALQRLFAVVGMGRASQQPTPTGRCSLQTDTGLLAAQLTPICPCSWAGSGASGSSARCSLGLVPRRLSNLHLPCMKPDMAAVGAGKSRAREHLDLMPEPVSSLYRIALVRARHRTCSTPNRHCTSAARNRRRVHPQIWINSCRHYRLFLPEDRA